MWDLTLTPSHDFYIQTAGTATLVHNVTCETAGDAALLAARSEAAAMQAAKASGDFQGRLPTMTSAAVDRTTGEVAGIGHSGDLGATPGSPREVWRPLYLRTAY